MVRRTLRVTMRAAVAMLLLLAIAIVALALMLGRRPLALPWLDRRIEQALGELVPELQTSVDRTELAWAGLTPDIRVLRVRALRKDGSLVASLPLLSVRPSLSALLRGRFAVSRVGLSGVKVSIVRNESGDLALAGGEPGAANEGGGLLSLMLQGVLAPVEVSYLRRIDLRDASLLLDDRKTKSSWEITQVDLDLRRRGTQVTAIGEGRARLRVGSVADLRALTLHMAARATATVVGEGVSEAAGTLAATDGEIAFDGDAAPPLPIRKLLAHGAFSSTTETVEISGIHAEIGGASGDARVMLVLAPARRRVETEGEIRGISASEVARLWPPSLAHATREWIGDNIRLGSVPRARFTLSVPLDTASTMEATIGAAAPAVLPASVDVGFEFDGLGIHYLGELPPARSLRGSATLTTERFTAKIASGAVGDLRVRGGNVAIDYHAHPATLAILADVDGASGELMALLDQPPLRVPTDIGIRAAGFGGTSEVHADIRLPIVAGLDASSVKVVADAKVHDATQRALLGRLGIAGGQLTVNVAEDRTVEVAGTTAFTGFPLVAAPANVRLRYAPQGAGVTIDATVDGPDIAGEGTATFVAGMLQTLAVGRLRLGRSDLKIDLIRDSTGSYRASLDGARFDLESAVRAFESPSGALPRPTVPYALDFRFAQVNIAPNLDLAEVSGGVASDGEHIQQATASGHTAEGGAVGLEIAAGPSGGTLRAHAEHGGEMLHALGYVEGVSGGTLQITAAIGDGGPQRRATGELEFTDFRVLNVPLLGRILSLGSLEGLAGLLGREGLAFSKLRAPFVWTDTAIEIQDARAMGSIGLTAAGTIDRAKQRIDVEGDLIPADALNSALGKVPLVGSLITGKSAEVFGIQYDVHGDLKTPEVHVHSLSALAPSALRNMFSAVFAEPTPKPPKTPPTTAPPS